MFFAASQLAWRAVVLLAIALAPWVAPVEARPAEGALGAGLHFALFVVVALALAVVVRAALRTHKLLAFVAFATLALMVLLPPLFDAERGPLARGVWLVAPLAWATLALGAAALFTRRLAPRFGGKENVARLVLLLGVATLGIASVFAGRHRLAPERLWPEALAEDPGNEEAAVVIAQQREAAGDRPGAYELLATCRAAHPATACRCAEGAAEAALDLSRPGDARRELDATRGACEKSARRLGLTAEALVFTGDDEAGERGGEAALALDDDDPHASFALAWLAAKKPDLARAKDLAGRAADFGRGLPALLLLGQVLIQQGALDAAKKALLRALELAPNDARATYDLALLAAKKGQYHDAREGYLRTLQLDPSFTDARYNLVLLTYGHGAVAEARHHLDELVASSPGDPRIPSLRAMLDKSP